MDLIHGPHFLNTFCATLTMATKRMKEFCRTSIRSPITIAAYSRYNNVLGNVLGTPGYHVTYKCAPSSPRSTIVPGLLSDCGQHDFQHWLVARGSTRLQLHPPAPHDTIASPSTMLWGNYDTVNNSVQWNNSEVPSGDPNYPNPVPSTQTISPSFYDGVYSAHQSCGTGLQFWKNPTTGTCPPYPSIGPDVSGGDIGMCSSGPYNWSRALSSSQCGGGGFIPSVNGGYAYSNPAMRCYLNQMGGTPNGTGAFLTFNAAACYAADAASGAPVPPTGLTATVH